MANVVQASQKYLPAQWHTSNSLNYSKAENERSKAEALRAECARLIQETSATTHRTQGSNSHKFSQRIRDIKFWRAELEKTLSENKIETDLLLQCKEQLEKALADTQFPLEVANTCLSFREKRVAIDVVHDQVEIELNLEVEVIQKVQELLQKTLDRTIEQIRLLRSSKHKLEKDLTDKLSALGIDDTCSELTDRTDGIGFAQQDSIRIQNNSVSPEQWAGLSNVNIEKAEEERNASSTLRGVINGVLAQTRQDIEKQRSVVNLEFSKRINEVATAKGSLEKHLNQVLAEIGEMEGNIDAMREAINAKTPPMILAQTRLDLRSQRPARELVRDPIQYGLVTEVGEISNSTQQLIAKLKDSEAQLKALIRSQLSLEEDIEVKRNSLVIDKEQCMVLRGQLN